MKKVFTFVVLMMVAIASSFAETKVEVLIDKYVESYEAGFYCTKPYEFDGQMTVVCTNPQHCEHRVLSFKDSTTAYFFCQAYKATCRSLTTANVDEVMASLNDLFRMFKYESAEIVGYYSMFDGYLIVACYNVEEK
jgi:hypothetical protein